MSFFLADGSMNSEVKLSVRTKVMGHHAQGNYYFLWTRLCCVFSYFFKSMFNILYTGVIVHLPIIRMGFLGLYLSMFWYEKSRILRINNIFFVRIYYTFGGICNHHVMNDLETSIQLVKVCRRYGSCVLSIGMVLYLASYTGNFPWFVGIKKIIHVLPRNNTWFFSWSLILSHL